MNRIAVLLVAVLLLATCGCVSVEVGTKPDGLRMSGLANGYVSVFGLRKFDGNILELHVLDWGARPGEVVSLDIWPLFGLGVGVAGFRTNALFLDVGFGTLFYRPRPPGWLFEEEDDGKDDEREEKHDEEKDGNDGDREDPYRHQEEGPDGPEQKLFDDVDRDDWS